MPKKAAKKRGKTAKAVKKVAKKATRKKSAKKKIAKVVKKAVKKASSEKVPKAPLGKEFFLINGKKVKDYEQLARIMEDLEDHVFHHHVSSERNDFSNWVKDVFKDIELAKKIAGIKSKDHLELVLYRRIVRGK